MRLPKSRSRASGYSLLLLGTLLLPNLLGGQVVIDSSRTPPPDTANRSARDSTPASAQRASRSTDRLRLISPYQLERERLAELAGTPATMPIVLRSVSAYITRADLPDGASGVFGPELQLVNNRHEHDGVLAGIAIVIVDHELGEVLDVGGVLGNQAAIRRAGHRRQERGETGVPAEDFDDQESLV